MWSCPKCGSKVDLSFDVCWACGTSRDGVEDPSFVPADAPPPDISPLVIDLPQVNDAATPTVGELVEAYWALDLMQAKFVADRLMEQGIPAVPDTHDMHDALGSMRSGPRVWVRAEDLPRAKAWLESYDQQFKAEHGSPDRD
jgi:hypothetical protein